MTRRRLGSLALVVALAVVLVAIGRWERDRRAAEQSRGMRSVLDAIGPLDSPSLGAFRVLGKFDCLLYKRGANPFALEVCVDRDGRVVEAIDRRDGTPEIWSLRDDPTKSSVSVDRTEVESLLDRMVVPPY